MTPPSTPPPINNQDLDKQLALLTQTVEGLRKDLETMGLLRDQWLQANLGTRVEKLEERVTEIEKLLVDMRPAIRGMTAVGGIVIALIIGLLWALLTGQAHVVYP